MTRDPFRILAALSLADALIKLAVFTTAVVVATACAIGVAEVVGAAVEDAGEEEP